MRTDIDDQRIIITGASSGIGRALALEYARRGARLVITARRAELLESLSREIVALGGQAAMLADDVTSAGAAERLLALSHEAFGGVDVIVMNAGIDARTFPREFTAERVERVMEVNYVAAVRLIAAALPTMVRERRGHLVAISSIASLRGLPGAAAYSSSKAALSTLMESLRIDLRGSGVRVSTISPGFVRTEILRSDDYPMPFMLDADDAARRIVKAIDRGAADYRFPLPTSLLMRIARVLPRWLFDPIAASRRRPE